jgi:uncharacterized membrane protein YoaK (UPF0700 family)
LVAGYLDVLTFFRFDVFVGMMTGNTVYIGQVIAEWDGVELLFYSACIVTNIFGAGIFECLCDPRWGIKRPVLAAAAVSTLLFATSLVIDLSAHGHRWQVIPLTTLMGLQNSVGLKPDSFVGINTTIVTGTCHKTGCYTYRLLFGPPGPWKNSMAQKDRDLYVLGLCVITTTVAGAIIGAVVNDYASSVVTWWNMFPAWLLQTACYLAHDRVAPSGKALPTPPPTPPSARTATAPEPTKSALR